MNVLRNHINESYYSCHYTHHALCSAGNRSAYLSQGEATDDMRKLGRSGLVDIGAVACDISKGPSAVIVTA